MTDTEQILNNLTPAESLNLDFRLSVELLKNLIGKENFEAAKKFNIPSPLKNYTNTDWAKTIKIVGINPRITKTYWGIVKYAMTFPENGIHLMPLFETGDGSLYVQNSWILNDEFLDNDLLDLGFKTADEQLKFVVNILHALGKVVGFDALAHVDNFSEIVILNPTCFEWIKLKEDKCSQDFSCETEELGKEIEALLISKFSLPNDFFNKFDEEKSKILFPEKSTRFKRRMELRQAIRNAGYEPVPVVEHAPMRPIVFEKMEYSKNSESWAVFSVKDKARCAKIIGSNTPYKFYKIKNGYPIKNTFDEKVVNYFIDKISKFQAEYDFDFLRADMAHNQISHSHNEEKDLKCPEMWAMLKDKIHSQKPYFASFAEAFWGNYYISGMQDMLNKKFDIVLGENNFLYMNESFTQTTTRFLTKYREKYRIFPSMTIFTNDGDLPEHNNLFTSEEANECRYFISLFLNLPSYMGMGFETRNLNPKSENEYSNPFVKKQKKEFEFGSNKEFFDVISDIRTLYKNIKEVIDTKPLTLIDTNDNKSMCWIYDITQKQKLLFCVNLNPNKNYIETSINNIKTAELIYTNSRYNDIETISINNGLFKINNLYIGECAVYNLTITGEQN